MFNTYVKKACKISFGVDIFNKGKSKRKPK